MKIRFVTWNMGDNKKTEDEWLSEISKSWSLTTATNETEEKCDLPFSKWCFDMLVVTVQEDYRGGRFLDSVSRFLGPEWVVQKSVVNGPPDFLKQPFSVKLYVYAKRNILPDGTQFNTASVCFKRALTFCSKGTAGVSVEIPGKGQIILMGSHFPVEPKKLDMGYQARVEAIQSSLKGVFSSLRNPDAPKVVAIWGGDMNFRRDTVVGNVLVDDQLKVAQEQSAFNVTSSSRFQERRNAENELEFPPTCKLHACKHNNCPVCRDRTDDETLEACYEDTRKPSHCDRIMFYVDSVDGSSVNLNPQQYRSWASGPGIQISDHNLVWADFELNW